MAKIGPPKGNINAKKLTTPELKQEAYKQYCEHIASGLPKECWVFKHPDLSIIWETMEQYIKDFPLDFPAINKKHAEAESYKLWYTRGQDMCLGEYGNKKVQPAIYQMIMRNKFGWDKETSAEKEAHRQGEVSLLEDIRRKIFSGDKV